MNFSLKIPSTLGLFLDCVKPEGRRNLYSVAAAAVSDLIRRHISAEVPRRHVSAQKLGATPTGHLEKAARGTVHSADDTHGEVVIPSPAFVRAFKDVEITPKRSDALTLPIHATAYGRTVRECRALGWNIFRPKGKDYLMGTRGGDETVPLYLLRKRVVQRQDRSLLPTDNDLSATATRAMMMEINRIARRSA